jgi:hypothetical protein
MDGKKAILDEIELGSKEEEGTNFSGPEFNEFLLSRLNLKILFKNIKIYFEYDHEMDLDFGSKKDFSTCFTIKEFVLQKVSSIIDF